MTDPTFLVQLAVNGIVVGVIYALMAMGLSLIFGVLEIVNFAHGEFYMLGAMIAYFLVARLHVGYWPMIAGVTLAVAALGVVLYEALLASVRGRSFERSILLTLGVSMVLQNGAIALWTTTPRMVETEYAYTNVTAGGIRIPLLRVFALALAAAAFAALFTVLHRTRIGKAMRGLAQNPDAALMVGIDPRAVSRLAGAIGIGLAGLAGAALAPIYSVHPTMGFAFVFKAFAVIIVGGLGDVRGAAIAAVALGVVESFVAGFFPLILVDAVAFVAMILFLLFRPAGLFGRGVRV
ncbi:MAG: branched-chain amino acid ABC transporter permease [Candidatus Rokubacteria bacterium]|nr:branched-chain amino acid ABC transporter permease [Candidatus Rokubacteria bacterium]